MQLIGASNLKNLNLGCCRAYNPCEQESISYQPLYGKAKPYNSQGSHQGRLSTGKWFLPGTPNISLEKCLLFLHHA
jgi:hypothetical protein